MSTIYWTGGAGNDARLSGVFYNRHNWSGGQVPGEDDDVVLGGSGYKVTLDYRDSNIDVVGSLLIGAGTKLMIQGALSDPDGTKETALYAQSGITNNGAIGLAGGSLSGSYSDTPDAKISGYGHLSIAGTVAGTIAATGSAGRSLTISTLHLTGKLSGSGTAVLSSDCYFEPGARVTVNNLDVRHGLFLADDLDLTSSHFSAEGARLNLQGHQLTINGGLWDGGDSSGWGIVLYGDLINKGKLVVTHGLDLNANLINNGTVDIVSGQNAQLDVFDGLSGNGHIRLQDGATLYDNYGGTVGSGQQIDLSTNNTIDLVNGTWEKFAGSVAGFGPSDVIQLSGFDTSGSAQLSYVEDGTGRSGTLTVQDGSDAFTVHLIGQYSAANFRVEHDAYSNLFIYDQNGATDIVKSGDVLHGS